MCIFFFFLEQTQVFLNTPNNAPALSITKSRQCLPELALCMLCVERVFHACTRSDQTLSDGRCAQLCTPTTEPTTLNQRHLELCHEADRAAVACYVALAMSSAKSENSRRCLIARSLEPAPRRRTIQQPSHCVGHGTEQRHQRGRVHGMRADAAVERGDSKVGPEVGSPHSTMLGRMLCAGRLFSVHSCAHPRQSPTKLNFNLFHLH